MNNKQLDPSWWTSKRWCYYLGSEVREDGRLRVSIIFEGVPGHFLTGGEGKAPWFWDEATCEAANAKRGLTDTDVAEIVSSSLMEHHRFERRRN